MQALSAMQLYMFMPPVPAAAGGVAQTAQGSFPFALQIFLKETEGSYEHSMLVGTEPFSVADVSRSASRCHSICTLL